MQRASGSKLVTIAQSVAVFFAFTGIVSEFWHVTWAAGVGVLAASAVALAVHSAGYTKLMYRRPAQMRRSPTIDESDGTDGTDGRPPIPSGDAVSSCAGACGTASRRRIARRGPPRSGRISISWPEMRVSASLSSVSSGQVGGQLDEREVGPDLDRAEVVAAESALVRERADDLARLDAGAACRRRCGTSPSASRRARPALGAFAAVVARPRGRRRGRRVRRDRGRRVERSRSARGTLRLGLEQQRRLALRDDGEGGRDVHLGHVVVRM